jgi:hypothetical protein
MKHIGRIDDTRVHEEVTALIPWHVNGTLGEHERQRLDAHLLLCANCRDALAQERRVFEGVSAEPAVEYMPAASLKRLQARLDSPDSAASAAAPPAAPATEAQGRRSMRWQGLMAASIAVMAVALSWLAADRWMQSRASPNYFTVTTAAPHVPGEVIRAVFSPTITLTELQNILDAAQLRIVAGPTEAGVYSLAANSARPVSSSLALLRQHSDVRFAESTQPSAASGAP